MDTSEFFPDGTPMDPWFRDTRMPDIDALGRRYVLSDHGIAADDRLHTPEIQRLIDRIHEEGGGEIGRAHV